MSSTYKRGAPFSERVYATLLGLYPTEFRREYGPHMAQVFRDLCRERLKGGAPNFVRLWADTLTDLIGTAAKEHLERKGAYIMRALRTIGLAIIIYAAAFILGGMFLEKMRGQLPSFLGSMIDALIAVGILFNLIVLVLWSTRLMPAARAVVTSGVVSAVLIGLVLVVISSTAPSDARPGGVAIITIALSLCVWFAVHWAWAQKKKGSAEAAA